MVKAHFDFGHGGKDPGALGNGLREKDLTLSIGMKTAKIVERHGVNISYSRTDDRFVDLTPRANMANSANADILVSFHINSATNTNARGFEIFTTKGQTKADILATHIGEQLMRDFPNVPFRMDMSDGDLDKEANFTVIAKSKMPAVLLELGFIVNSLDAQILKTQQDKLSLSVAKGILSYLGIPYKDDNSIQLDLFGNIVYVPAILRGNTNYINIQGKEYTIWQILEGLGLKGVWDNKSNTVKVNE